MALSRRSQRYEGNVWPGFVDAMTALLLVLIFVLSIFMIVQFVLRDLVTGKDAELDNLTMQLAEIAQVLSTERSRGDALEGEVGDLTASLEGERAEVGRLSSLAESLANERDAAQARNAEFEARVAALLADVSSARERIGVLTAARDEQAERAEGAEQALTEARTSISELEAAQTRAISDAEQMRLALARLRDEVSEGEEAARLAAAQREALQAMVADLKAEAEAERQALEAARDAARTEVMELRVTAEEKDRVLAALQEELSEEEQARAAQAAAADALRARLEGSETELTAMQLALEEQRKKAEETLTLLAAAEAAKAELEGEVTATEDQLAEARARMTEREAMLASAERRLAQEKTASADEARRVALLNAQAEALRRQLGGLQELLNAEESKNEEMQVQLSNLGSQLNSALARELQLKQREAERNAEEVARLEAEKKSLEARRSEFFGRIREAIEGREGVKVVGDRFVFQSEVLFDPGSADLGQDGQAALSEFAEIFRSFRDALPDELPWVLRVDGHTDDVPLSGGGRYRDNWELSQARALSVVRYLSQEQSFPPERLAANGFGEYQPVDPGDSPEARARNRRIELKLTER